MSGIRIFVHGIWGTEPRKSNHTIRSSKFRIWAGGILNFEKSMLGKHELRTIQIINNRNSENLNSNIPTKVLTFIVVDNIFTFCFAYFIFCIFVTLWCSLSIVFLLVTWLYVAIPPIRYSPHFKLTVP